MLIFQVVPYGIALIFSLVEGAAPTRFQELPSVKLHMRGAPHLPARNCYPTLVLHQRVMAALNQHLGGDDLMDWRGEMNFVEMKGVSTFLKKK